MSQQLVYNFLNENKGKCYSVKELAEILGINTTTTYSNLKKLKSWEEVHVVD